jgi:hypothetical protein
VVHRGMAPEPLGVGVDPARRWVIPSGRKVDPAFNLPGQRSPRPPTRRGCGFHAMQSTRRDSWQIRVHGPV